MARSRTLKPEFWTDDVIVELSFAARLWYQGFWNFALCDQGHIDATPKSLKMKIFPADDVDPVALTEELIKWGRVERKETPDGRTYLHVSTLAKHTKMDTRWNTRCPYCALEGLAKPAPAPPTTDGHAETHASPDVLTETHASLFEPPETPPSKGKEGKGREGESERKRGTRIPDDFSITPEMREWARGKAPGVDLELQTVKFKNHFAAKTGQGATMLRWDLAWQNWILRALEYGGARASPAPTPEPGYFQPLT